MNKEVVGANLLRLRQGKSLSQSEVAERSGISRVAYRKLKMAVLYPRSQPCKTLPLDLMLS